MTLNYPFVNCNNVVFVASNLKLPKYHDMIFGIQIHMKTYIFLVSCKRSPPLDKQYFCLFVFRWFGHYLYVIISWNRSSMIIKVQNGRYSVISTRTHVTVFVPYIMNSIEYVCNRENILLLFIRKIYR